MAYRPKEWVNTVYDDEGNVLRKGTPLMAEDMNKIEDGIVQNETDIQDIQDSKGQANGIASLNSNGVVNASQLPSMNKTMEVVDTISQRDSLVTSENLRVLVLDASGDSTVESGWAEYIYHNGVYLKLAEAESLDVILEWANVKNKPSVFNPSSHTHSHQDIDGLYVTHAHDNKVALDRLTELYLDKIRDNVSAIEGLETDRHTHENKSIIDKINYTGSRSEINLTFLEELETHTHNYDTLLDKPNIPTKVSDLENDSNFISNTGITLNDYVEKVVTTTGIIDLAQANIFHYTPTANNTIGITNAKVGVAHSFTLIIDMGATVRTLTFPASVKWQGGEIPDMSNADKTYILTFMSVDGGSTWFGNGSDY